MIKVNNLSKSFGSFQALDNVNMYVGRGSVYGLVGPNGAGKSTIIRHITGIFRPDAGEVIIDNEPVFENASLKSRIAYVPDDLFYFPQANLLDMKKYYQGLYPQFDCELFGKLNEVFPAVNPKHQIRRMSKGMQKQAIFWLALCTRPDVMILDEPVDGLDPVMRKQVWSLILAEVAERDLTVLVSSHNLRELEDVCDHVGIMHQGKLLIERSLEELQGSVMKIQVAFSADAVSFPDDLAVLHHQQMGHAHTLIIKGDPDEIKAKLASMNPLFLDLLPLTLEEIFIYEMGGMNYEIKDILLA